MSKNRFFILTWCVGFVLCLFVTPTCIAAEKPNIIVIMSDDVGYGDLGVLGAVGVETPNLDKMAQEGIRFVNGYCSAATCTPTRFSLLTGIHAFRYGGTGIAPPNATALIKPGTFTMPAMLQNAGYKTAVVGKWHLGLGTPPKPDWNGELKPGPLEVGFDYCFIYPTTNDRVPSVYIENHRVKSLDSNDPLDVREGAENPWADLPTGVTHRDTLKMDWSNGHNQTIHNGIGRIGWVNGGTTARWRDEDLTTELTDKCIEWIKTNKENPFFLFYATSNIHVPRMPHERFHGKSSLGFRGDSLVELDWSVGEIMKALEREGLLENTIVVFTADNGPVLDDGYKDGAVEKLGDHKPAGILRGGKYSPYEGGTRIPFFVQWKGKITPGISQEIINTIDLPATFAAMLGERVPAGAFSDSFALNDALLGVPDAKGRPFNINEAAGRFGFRKDHWKIVSPPQQGQTPGRQDMVRYELFNLAVDPSETTNLAGQQPERLKELFEEFQKHLVPFGRPLASLGR
ncbi:MAG: arylsulfatase [Planctomycetaceae bacterium]|nr:arylsulfatase [Planctomycetaceae bacterium]